MQSQTPESSTGETGSSSAPISPSALPGPRGIPILGASYRLRGVQFHTQLEAWALEYGPRYAFKLGRQQVVVVTESAAIREALQRRPHAFTRGRKLRDVFEELQIDGVFSAEGERWRRERKLVMPGFLPGQLERFFPRILLLVEKLKSRWIQFASDHREVDISSEFMRFTTDVTTRLAFGYESDLIGDREDELYRDLQLIFPAISRRMSAPFPYWKYVPLSADRKVTGAVGRVQAVMRKIAASARQRMQASPELRQAPETALEAMLALEFNPDEALRMSEQELTANMLTLLLAGEDTTSTTLAWFAYEMLCDPTIQSKLHAEVDRELPSRAGLERFRDPQKLPYLESVAQETLRVRSTAPCLFLQATGPTTVDGIELTPNDLLIALSRVGAMQDEHFSDAQTFCPDRWMRTNPESAKRCPVHEPKSIFTFGSGPRVCPGRNLALLEIHAVMAMFARNFVLEWAGAPTKVEEIFEFTMHPSPFKVRLRRRTTEDQVLSV